MGIITVYGYDPNFVCHVQMPKFMYQKPRNLFIQKLYFKEFSHLQKNLFLVAFYQWSMCSRKKLSL